MFEAVILGRGGQGAQTAGNQLAQALFAQGLYVQTFSTYGGARRGTPVTSSLRADAAPIRLRANITRADALLCFDDSLIDAGFLSLAKPGAVCVVNSALPVTAFDAPDGVTILPVDGRSIARRNDMGKVVNSALLGGFVAAVGSPDIDTMCRIIEATAPAKKVQNVASCREAYAIAQGQREEVDA